jgi:hypothetical protein
MSEKEKKSGERRSQEEEDPEDKFIVYKQGVCVSHIVALPYLHYKRYVCILKAQKKELWKLKSFTMQKYNLPKTIL